MQENWDLSRRKSMGVALLSLASAREAAEAEVYFSFVIILLFYIYFLFHRMIPKMTMLLMRRNQMKQNQKWPEKELRDCQVWYLKKLKINENK